MNPVGDQPLQSRDDFQQAAVKLFKPLRAHFSPGRARVNPGGTGTSFPDVAVGLEGFARPLWGLAPLAAGGGDFDHWSLFRTGIRNGTDPSHPEYWLPSGDYDQKHVEMAAVGVGLALAPDELWDPLSAETQQNLVEALNQANDASLYECNWKFFRVLATLGLRSVNADHDWERTQETLNTLESFYLDNGWYSDGPADERPCDHYIAWSMHCYGLIYASLAADDDPKRADRFRERARQFAKQYKHWFHQSGAGLPFGRSLTYRTAQAAFWGSLALADVEALPWGEIRGLWARNIRWWLDQPIFTNDGVLSIGYRYPNLKMSESYNSPSSPYWAMKAFLPLALPADHPFWEADERPLSAVDELTVQPEPKMIICRDDEAGHHYALTAGQNSQYLEKYSKITYSTEFGFGICTRAQGLAGSAHDGALVLSEDESHYRLRLTVEDATVDGTTLYSRWDAWDDVTVDTWVAPALPWHVRIHRIDTSRRLHSGEGGFALDRSGNEDPDAFEHTESLGRAFVQYPAGTGGIRDLRGDRSGCVVNQDPNTNVCYPRTVVPTLTGTHDPGIHWIATAVTAASADHDEQWDRPPVLTTSGDTAVVTDAAGETILRCDADAPGPLDAFTV
ncbi:DUF2264 domain-containing protein [Halocatena marina]|uniref:DUF2264 domain-containing protein n=1 Tax=Halocatena marina TaxID=2934937 RepID=UPI0020100D15|nr:DUF2264 domain-containing protein [Halocatena marina]